MIIIESSNFSKFSCSRYYDQISLPLVFTKFAELHRILMLNFSKYEEQQILGRLVLPKFIHQNRNQHITMCSCIKFQLIWRTIDFRTKFAQIYMNDKNFEKRNIKIVISI